jgi:calcineurin-like phosphoesterase family protein
MGKLFLIADCHFGAKEVIRVFKRPFATVKEMDRVMTENWNRAVGPDDTVIIIGDFTYDTEDRKRLLAGLFGNKILIRGNHDRGGPEAGADHMVLAYRGQMLYLIHNPDHAPEGWKGWTVHGHHHWRMPDYPFIDGKWRTINVACELIGYTPVDIDWILGLGIGTVLRMETIDSEPVRRGIGGQ